MSASLKIKKLLLAIFLLFIVAFSFNLLNVPYASTLSSLSVFAVLALVCWLFFELIKSVLALVPARSHDRAGGQVHNRAYLGDFFRAVALWFIGGGFLFLFLIPYFFRNIAAITLPFFWPFLGLSAIVIIINYIAVRYSRATKNNPTPSIMVLIDLFITLPLILFYIIILSGSFVKIL